MVVIPWVFCSSSLLLARNDTTSSSVPSLLIPSQQNNSLAQSSVAALHPRDVIEWQEVSAIKYANDYLSVILRLISKDNFSIYSDKLEIASSLGSRLTHRQFPDTQTILDPLTKMPTEVYSKGIFEIILKVDPQTTTIPELSLTYLSCTDTICLFPYTHTFPINYLTSADDYSVPVSAKAVIAGLSEVGEVEEGSRFKQSQSYQLPADSISAPSPKAQSAFSWDQRLARSLKSRGISFFWMLLICFLGGLLTNITPCVYPMIPITMKVLTRHHNSPYLASLCYGTGIFITYLVIGLMAAVSGGLFGGIVAGQSFNLVFGLAMMIMAFSMLGYGNFSFLQTFGSRIPQSLSPTKNAFFMGSGAGLVAAPCTGPVLAGLLSYAIVELTPAGSLMLFAAYSMGFAAPYVLFGSAIAHLGKIRLSSSVQNITKLLMASAIATLAFYYWRIPFYKWIKEVSQQQWVVISLSFCSLAVIMTLIMVVKPQMQAKKRYFVAPMLAFALGLFATIQVIQMPSRQSLPWVTDEQSITQLIESSSSPILISLWAEWCAACKVMEASTFQDVQVTSLLKKHDFSYIKHDLTIMDKKATALLKKYKIHGLPAYILINPSKQKSDQNKVLHGVYKSDHFMEIVRDHLNTMPK